MTNSENTLESSFLNDGRKAHLHRLKSQEKELRFLCQELDPYLFFENKDQISKKLIPLLKKYGAYHSSDPFELTNKLISQLEDIIEELEAHKKTKKYLQ